MRFLKPKLQKTLLLVILAGVLALGKVGRAARYEYKEVFVPIVTYHRLTGKPKTEIDLTPEQLQRQFQYFRDAGYQPITATEMLNCKEDPGSFPEKPLVLTFDDGPLSNYTIVFPLLKKYGWKATFFIYPKVIAKKSKTQLTWNQLRKMAAAGMDIQSHTLSHPFLTSIDAAGKERYSKWLKRELQESKRIIEANLKRKVDLLAYPYGWFNKYVEKRCFRWGYRAVFTINYGVNRVEPKRVRFDRFVITNNLSLGILKSFLTAKPLEIESIVPKDGETILGLREIRFRLKDRRFKQVEVKFRRQRETIRCDRKGVFTFIPRGKIPTGYQMVIVKVQGAQGENYLASWGFEYQLPVCGGDD
jgi:peptidoglycan/xylan/chitin deacetylase (PgdA/CDA1 family)